MHSAHSHFNSTHRAPNAKQAMIHLKKWVGIGLVGQLATVLSRARTTGAPICGEVACHISVASSAKYCFRVSMRRDSGPVGYVLGPAFWYEQKSSSFLHLLSVLTRDVAEARSEFPGLRFTRILRLPTKDHKLQYYLHAAKLGEAWLEDAIRASASRPYRHEFEIREEFVNGTWLPYQDKPRLHLTLHQAKCLIIHAGFRPLTCSAEIVNGSNPPYIRYALSRSSEAITTEGRVYVYPYDFWFDLYPAINCERELLSQAGIVFDPPEIDLRPFLGDCEEEEYEEEEDVEDDLAGPRLG